MDTLQKETGFDVLLAQPRGFCAGVRRAVDIVERALELYGPPVYVLHEIVHNSHVLEELKSRGAIFVEDLEEVPDGSVTIFSAHGVAERVEAAAGVRGLRVIDATCPLVTKVHLQAQRYERKDYEIVLVGHEGHPEIEGTKGRIHGKVHVLCSVEEVDALEVVDPSRLSFVTQTTLSVDDTRDVVDALRRRFPEIQGPDLDDICYATQNRQNAVRDMTEEIDVLLVVGSANSSNSNRLRELGARRGVPSFLIDSDEDLERVPLHDGQGRRMRVGLTAGASAPETLVELVIERLRLLGDVSVRQLDGDPEDVVFSLPHSLRPGETVTP